MLNLPNILSIFRIFLVPLLIWLIISGNYEFALYVFVTAGITDAIDGYLAKRFHWETELGAYLDPLADKALLTSAFAVLGALGHLPVWIVIMVISRDILIVGALILAWMLGRPMQVQPLYVSKANTLCQIMLVAFVLFELGFGLGVGELKGYFVLLVGGLTLLSAAAYLFSWLRHMTTFERQPNLGQMTQRTEFGASGQETAIGLKRQI